MAHWRILAVDDEPVNLEIIAEILDSPDYTLDMAEDGAAAWQRLHSGAYDLLILDRMMPRMDGMELLRRLKADARFNALPVIMQTAASSPDQVREGLEAGAYYYLAKPYEPRTLSAIVRSALEEIAERRSAERQEETHRMVFGLAQRCEFAFRTLEEAQRLASFFSVLCPDPGSAGLGLTELLVNAVEHGNLGISYTEKSRLRFDDAWEAEIQRRLQLPELASRVAKVVFQRESDALVFIVTDQGAGFDWTHYLEFDPARACDPNGRGIAMARLMAFSSLEYQGCGNVAVARIQLAK
ncbi:MAG: response regulator [Rhodocyclaceae bacterium]|nr:response regulator [Rhodocyclaceae bacterium]